MKINRKCIICSGEMNELKEGSYEIIHPWCVDMYNIFIKRLLQMGYTKDLKSMQAIGYRHMIDFMNDHMSWNESLHTFKRDTRRYAKRQLTWFKADTEIVWIDPGQVRDVRLLVKRFLQD
ncbi:hypothetical protein LCGC14_2089890 [marine sediment metagenome]|uniref:tRNA dimethylallyltransferase n=1 Tax=marine sediment metagenome TaxID=412755 RepID=A0A0F9H9V3_9ZZZZ